MSDAPWDLPTGATADVVIGCAVREVVDAIISRSHDPQNDRDGTGAARAAHAMRSIGRRFARRIPYSGVHGNIQVDRGVHQPSPSPTAIEVRFAIGSERDVAFVSEILQVISPGRCSITLGWTNDKIVQANDNSRYISHGGTMWVRITPMDNRPVGTIHDVVVGLVSVALAHAAAPRSLNWTLLTPCSSECAGGGFLYSTTPVIDGRAPVKAAHVFTAAVEYAGVLYAKYSPRGEAAGATGTRPCPNANRYPLM